MTLRDRISRRILLEPEVETQQPGYHGYSGYITKWSINVGDQTVEGGGLPGGIQTLLKRRKILRTRALSVSAVPGSEITVDVPSAYVLSDPEGASVNCYWILKNHVTGAQLDFKNKTIIASGIKNVVSVTGLKAQMPSSGQLTLRLELDLYKAPFAKYDWLGLDQETATVYSKAVPVDTPPTIEPTEPSPYEITGQVAALSAPTAAEPGTTVTVVVPWMAKGGGNHDFLFIIVDRETDKEYSGRNIRELSADGRWREHNFTFAMPDKDTQIYAKMWLWDDGNHKHLANSPVYAIQKYVPPEPVPIEPIPEPPPYEPDPEVPSIQPDPISPISPTEPIPPPPEGVPEQPVTPIVPWWVAWLQGRFPRLQRKKGMDKDTTDLDVQLKAR